MDILVGVLGISIGITLLGVSCRVCSIKNNIIRNNEIHNIWNKLNKNIVEINPLTDPEECCICLKYFCETENKIVRLKCSHIYHRECIFRWLMKKRNCPICKARV